MGAINDRIKRRAGPAHSSSVSADYLAAESREERHVGRAQCRVAPAASVSLYAVVRVFF